MRSSKEETSTPQSLQEQKAAAVDLPQHKKSSNSLLLSGMIECVRACVFIHVDACLHTLVHAFSELQRPHVVFRGGEMA